MNFNATDVENNKVMAILSYFSWLVLVPIFAAKDSEYAQFHANQGLVLALTEIVWWIAEGVVSGVIHAISWKLDFLLRPLSIVNLLFLTLMIYGIVNAATGKGKELPVIGKIQILKR